MQNAITGSLFVILLAGAAAAQERIAEQDGLGIVLEELLTERGTINLEFGTTISASSIDGVSGLYQPTIFIEPLSEGGSGRYRRP
jgi:hypothetical protein